MMVQIASVMSLQLWIRFLYWFRIFPETAIYIKMVGETIYDLRNFFFIFLMCLASFGNAMLILDKY